MKPEASPEAVDRPGSEGQKSEGCIGNLIGPRKKMTNKDSEQWINNNLNSYLQYTSAVTSAFRRFGVRVRQKEKPINK